LHLVCTRTSDTVLHLLARHPNVEFQLSTLHSTSTLFAHGVLQLPSQVDFADHTLNHRSTCTPLVETTCCTITQARTSAQCAPSHLAPARHYGMLWLQQPQISRACLRFHSPAKYPAISTSKTTVRLFLNFHHRNF
jgi:hypothetical protein